MYTNWNGEPLPIKSVKFINKDGQIEDKHETDVGFQGFVQFVRMVGLVVLTVRC